MLREWAGATGYVTRDVARFAVPYLVSEPVTTKETVATAAPQPIDKSVVKSAPSGSAQRPARRSVNRATVEELAAIKGLSRTVAVAIVKGRPYPTIDAVLAVHGVGPKLLARLRADLTLD